MRRSPPDFCGDRASIMWIGYEKTQKEV